MSPAFPPTRVSFPAAASMIADLTVKLRVIHGMHRARLSARRQAASG
jgi:hypothetical protein